MPDFPSFLKEFRATDKSEPAATYTAATSSAAAATASAATSMALNVSIRGADCEHSSTHMCTERGVAQLLSCSFSTDVSAFQTLFRQLRTYPIPSPGLAAIYKSKSSTPAILYVCWCFVPLPKLYFHCEDSLRLLLQILKLVVFINW